MMKGALPDDFIMAMAPRSGKALWIATPRGLYSVAQKDDDDFNASPAAPRTVITGLAEGPRNAPPALLFPDGLVRWDGAEWRALRLPEEMLRSAQASAAFVDGTRGCIGTTDNQVGRIDGDIVTKLPSPPGPADAAGRIVCSGDTVWLLSVTGRLLRYSNGWREFPAAARGDVETVDFIFPVGQEDVLIAGTTGAAALVGDHTVPLTNNEGIVSATVVSDGQIWFGGALGDVLIFSVNAPEQLRRVPVIAGPAESESRNPSPVQAILATSSGVWIGTRDGRVGKLDGKTGRWTPETFDEAVNKLVEGREGDIWVGTRGKATLRSADGRRFPVAFPPGALLRSVVTLDPYRVAIGGTAGLAIVTSERPALDLLSSKLLFDGVARFHIAPGANDSPADWRIVALDSADAGVQRLPAAEIVRRGKALPLDAEFRAQLPTGALLFRPHYVAAVAMDRAGAMTTLGGAGGPLWRVPNPLTSLYAAIPWSSAALVLSWLSLLAVYPRSKTARTLIFASDFWRRALSFWAFDIAVFAVPGFGRYLLRPFRDDLRAGAQVERAQAYYGRLTVAELTATSEAAAAAPIEDVIDIRRSRVILMGRSGSGKTHFLRRQLERTRDAVVFLEAKACADGVVEGIRQRLPHYVRDSGLFEKVLYSGRLTVLIDGLNEADADTRAKIEVFLHQFPAAAVVITSQPLTWRPKTQMKVFQIDPIPSSDISPFFESLGYMDEAFRERQDAFLAEINATTDPLQRFLVRDVLSTPHDLTLIGLLLRNGQKPDLSGLQNQQIRLADKELENRIGRGLDITRLGKKAFDARVKGTQESARAFDPADIDEVELDVLTTFRILIRMRDGKTYYQFRHDRIQDFLIVLDRDTYAQAEADHQDDIRFAGVFAMMAERLPRSHAKELLASLAATASQTGEFGVMTLLGRRLRDLELAERH